MTSPTALTDKETAILRKYLLRAYPHLCGKIHDSALCLGARGHKGNCPNQPLNSPRVSEKEDIEAVLEMRAIIQSHLTL